MKRSIRYITTSLSLSAALAWLIAPGLSSAATAQASLYVPNSHMTAATGADFTVPVRLNPSGNEIDTVDVKVAFPVDQLTFVGLDKGGSAFDTFVPSTPTAQGGSVEFAAAHLGKAVTSDALVANLRFTAKATTGSAAISLDESAAARNGADVSVATTGTTVAFSQGGTSGTVKLVNIQATDVRVNGATIRWKTNVAATSSVDYGTTKRYGFTAGSDDLVTDHSVVLDPVFGGDVTVHFALTSRDASGNVGVSSDATFQTNGYTVAITVKDKSGKTLSGAEVKVGDAAAVKADANGVAVVNDVAPGNQKVVVNGGKTQFVAVQAVNGGKAVAIQKFALTAEAQPLWPRLLLGVAIIGLAVAALLWWRHHRATPTV